MERATRLKVPASRSSAGEAAEWVGIGAGARRATSTPMLVLLRLMFVGDKGEAELFGEPRNCLVIVANDEGDVGEGLRRLGTVPKYSGT